MGQGRLLRRLRRFAPYPLIGAALFWLEPLKWRGSDAADQVLDLAGLAVILAGEALRLWTWGANAQAGLFSLRSHGPYALLRHPLYAGNFLIVCGALMILNNPVAYAVGIPSFALLYAIIARKEEHHLLLGPALGPSYRAYTRAQPNRFLPNLRRWRVALALPHRFDWWFAAEKEYESVFGILLGWVALDFFEEFVIWRGASHGGGIFYTQLAILGLIAVAAPALYYQKKAHRRRPTPPPAAALGTGDQEPGGASGAEATVISRATTPSP
jgi:protein-S-isoprenylcysteine O-methyltransferase Ste14